VSFDIYIGEAVLDVPSAQDASEGALIEAYVEHVTLLDAPVFAGDIMTGNGNSRHPGYSQWAEFCKITHLDDLFFDESVGLMRAHPGCVLLQPHHRAAVRKALGKWEEEHQGAHAGFENGQDGILARLLWLDFWIGWALANCKVPAIYNH